MSLSCARRFHLIARLLHRTVVLMAIKVANSVFSYRRIPLQVMSLRGWMVKSVIRVYVILHSPLWHIVQRQITYSLATTWIFTMKQVAAAKPIAFRGQVRQYRSLDQAKAAALRVSISSKRAHVSDVRAAFGFVPVSVKGAVIHWPAL